MINNLVRQPAVVLQDVEVLSTNSLGELLCHGLLYIIHALVQFELLSSG